MKEFNKGGIARGLLPYVATVLSISLAVTLRIEPSCSFESYEARQTGTSASIISISPRIVSSPW